MIVDLNLHNKSVIVVGGGKEAQKRIDSLIKEGCNIIVISDKITSKISRLVKLKKIKLKKGKVHDTKFISEFKPNLIITTTTDRMLNQKIINHAKKRKIIAYSSDNPEESDFSNTAIIDFEKMIQIAIFTGGRSPAMSKKLKTKSEEVFRKIITKEDVAQIKIQKIARDVAKEKIHSTDERKACIHSIMADNEIDQLIKDGQIKKAEKRAITIVRNWK